ncbi:hypothetical protein FF38_14518 [Lucilia cuprina]|uniref:Uncharacterized protein n=1 Tax=Lucilia cuprina TaxID=7375 RepID=A0A0L0CDF0_LUCCU|nr:hypothetical protein FF38_14518 [Lucilia cuprina]
MQAAFKNFPYNSPISAGSNFSISLGAFHSRLFSFIESAHPVFKAVPVLFFHHTSLIYAISPSGLLFIFFSSGNWSGEQFRNLTLCRFFGVHVVALLGTWENNSTTKSLFIAYIESYSNEQYEDCYHLFDKYLDQNHSNFCCCILTTSAVYMEYEA